MSERLDAFWLWLHDTWMSKGELRSNCMIRSRKGTLIPLLPNQIQERIHETMMRQAQEGVPIRIVGLKDRKPGFSTWIQALSFFLTQNTDHWFSQVIAHTFDDTRQIFAIGRRIASHNTLEPAPVHNRGEIEFPNNDSIFNARTAGGDYVSSGATVNLLHISELAKWPGDSRAVTAQLASLMNAVPEDPMSIVVIESTAEMGDTAEQFKDRYYDAAEGRSPYAAVFHAWWENEAKRTRVRGSLEPLDDDEKRLIERFGVDDEQLQWRRDKIAGDCKHDKQIFMQDHPATPEEAFQVAAGKIFPMLGDKHCLSVSDADLEDGDYQFFRGIDWGGADPFVCMWIAYREQPEKPAFTIDKEACPNAWRELNNYHYDDHGKPKDKNNHTIDALRYAIVQYHLHHGHCHVFHEMYIPGSAAIGMSDVTHAREIMAYDRHRLIDGTVADPSQPKTINLVNDIGLCVTAYERGGRINDIKDGISRMRGIMLSDYPMTHIEPPKTPRQTMFDRLVDGELDFVNDTELMVAAEIYEETHAADPYFGALG